MSSISDLLKGVEVLEIDGRSDHPIGQPEIDSRKINTNGLFVAVRGNQTDGHKFIDKAIQNGAKTIVAEEWPTDRQSDVQWVRVQDTALAAGVIAHNFFGRPSLELRLVGVTGTNGKTTTVTLLHDLTMSLGITSGLISTVECRVGSKVLPSTHTTPDPISLNRILREIVDGGCEVAFMEVSSHAIDQQRTAGINYAGAVFTNITHDHLDYHGTFRHYLDTKKKFFDGLGAQAFALVNTDDQRGNYMVQNTIAKVSKYSLHKLADFKGKVLSNRIDGLHLRIDDIELISRLVGQFNAYNLLAVYGTAILLGFDKHDVLTALSNLKPAEGRFEIVRHPESGKSAIVDYAHTPDALEKVLSTLQHLVTTHSKIIAVVGCGGDRDKAKRPRMAFIASQMADMTILTSDNPRSEDPEEILNNMLEGVAKEQRSKVLKITDRREAIRAAVQFSKVNDIVLIAGKGHEKYQEINSIKHPFDDKKIVLEALTEEN